MSKEATKCSEAEEISEASEASEICSDIENLTAPVVIDTEFLKEGKITLLNKANDSAFRVSSVPAEESMHITLSIFVHRLIIVPSSFWARKEVHGILEAFAKKVDDGTASHLITECFTERVLGMADNVDFLIKDEKYEFDQESAREFKPEDDDYGELVGVTLFLRKDLTLEDFQANLEKIRQELIFHLKAHDELLSQNGGSLMDRYKAITREEKIPDPPVGARIKAVQAEIEAYNETVEDNEKKFVVDKGPPTPVIDAIKIKATGQVCAMKDGKEVDIRAKLPNVGWSPDQFEEGDDFDWKCFVLYMRMHSGLQKTRELLQRRMEKDGANLDKILEWEKKFMAGDQEVRDRVFKKKK